MFFTAWVLSLPLHNALMQTVTRWLFTVKERILRGGMAGTFSTAGTSMQRHRINEKCKNLTLTASYKILEGFFC